MSKTALQQREELKNKESVSEEEMQLKRIIVKPDTTDSSLSSRRIVLLGKTGVGKSAAGNTILGQKVFRSERRMVSVTSECSEAHAIVSGRSVSVVDAPGFFDTQMETEELITEIARSVYLSIPGPHAFLIVFSLNIKFTEQEQQIPQMIERLFGEEVLKYSIILFTSGDQLEDENMEELIKENEPLGRLVDQCRGGYHVFNNKALNDRQQVDDLLQKIDSMIEQNGGGHYSNQMYEDAQRLAEEEKRMKDEAKQEEEQIRVKNSESSGFESFNTQYRRYLIAAAVGAGIIAPLAAGVAGFAAATGVAVAAAKGFAIGAVSGAAAGFAGAAAGGAGGTGGDGGAGAAAGGAGGTGGDGGAGAAAGADRTHTSQQDKQKKKQQ